MGLFNTPGQWRGYFGSPLTPYDAAGRIDEEVYAQEVEFLIGNGAPALCSLMHVGESLNLSADERRRVTELTVEVAAGRVPVIAHVSLPGTQHTVELAEHAQSVGAQGVVSVTPYHWRPTDEGLYEHFVAVGSSVDVALLTYSYPAAFGVGVSPQVATRLVERLPNYLGAKQADYDMQTFTEMVRALHVARPDFSVFAGVEYLLPALALGGCGSLSACGVVAPRLLTALWQAASTGDFEGARELQWKMGQLFLLLTSRYPATIKAAAGIMGREVGPTRLPVLPLAAEEVAALAAELDAMGILESEPYGWALDAEPDPERARASVRGVLAAG
ncbi:4-hydroxy-tetrahydrodipicolinate synthase [Baekduia alba]|uniref:dihydrodipicolinate synthase family protein n=1 Tax=Baekduia alba TaxID=2997333 RepID=UPI00234001F5|nr:dihydrodipicolinate synthase family protein [Baekduia alba]WCB96861.1 4-hydroxy-tetrahydrodipicolinate synthase [Baekduia alba]